MPAIFPPLGPPPPPLWSTLWPRFAASLGVELGEIVMILPLAVTVTIGPGDTTVTGWVGEGEVEVVEEEVVEEGVGEGELELEDFKKSQKRSRKPTTFDAIAMLH